MIINMFLSIIGGKIKKKLSCNGQWIINLVPFYKFVGGSGSGGPLIPLNFNGVSVIRPVIVAQHPNSYDGVRNLPGVKIK